MPDWDQDDTGNKVCCRICAEVNPEGAGHWIARRGSAKHITTNAHLRSVALRQSRLGTSHTEAEDGSTSNLDNPYTAGTIELQDLEKSFENTSQRITLTGAVDATQDIHGVSAADFLFTQDEQAAYFPELPSDILLTQTAEELLRAEFERLVLQAQEEDVMGSLADIGSEEMSETAPDQLPRPCERAPGQYS